MNPLDIPAAQDVLDAARRIENRVRRTPVLDDAGLDQLSGARLHFKCENLQYGGAFKLRGAMNAVWSLSETEASAGVATHSSGNHGAALALAARSRGIACHAVVPDGAVRSKLDNIAANGAMIHRCAANQQAREAGLALVLAQTGAVPIPPFDDARVIAGQGTAALELMQDVPGLECLVAPVGGGGLAAGTVLAAGIGSPTPLVYAAEPRGADDTWRSLSSGVRVTEQVPATIADGLRTTVGARNFEILRGGLAAVLCVDEHEIIAAMKLAWSRLKLVIEPSSAVALAAILRHREHFAGRRVGVILSGGNVDLDQLPWLTQQRPN